MRERAVMKEIDVVTGAFGYTGRHVARALEEKGRIVRTLTNHPAKRRFGEGPIEAFPLHLDDDEILKKALDGAETPYNTYWIRFPHGDKSFERAVADTEHLVAAASAAGVRRTVHVT